MVPGGRCGVNGRFLEDGHGHVCRLMGMIQQREQLMMREGDN